DPRSRPQTAISIVTASLRRRSASLPVRGPPSAVTGTSRDRNGPAPVDSWSGSVKSAAARRTGRSRSPRLPGLRFQRTENRMPPARHGRYGPHMDPRTLVQQLAQRPGRLDTIRRLAGGVTATELRRARVDQATLDALAAGVRDPDSRVRWWCVQLLDHLADPHALTALTAALNDPVPRVRRNACHALGCLACNPSWDGILPAGAAGKIRQLAATDPNPKVRAEADRALRRTVR